MALSINESMDSLFSAWFDGYSKTAQGKKAITELAKTLGISIEDLLANQPDYVRKAWRKFPN
jgi:hypothetical protein